MVYISWESIKQSAFYSIGQLSRRGQKKAKKTFRVNAKDKLGQVKSIGSIAIVEAKEDEKTFLFV